MTGGQSRVPNGTSPSKEVIVVNTLKRISLILGLAAAVATYAHGGTIWVPDDYPTISDACEVAVSGDSILVRAGEYYESAHVPAGISIIGAEEDSTSVRVYPIEHWSFCVSGGPDPVLIEKMEIHGRRQFGAVKNYNPGLVIQRCYLYGEGSGMGGWATAVHCLADTYVRKSAIRCVDADCSVPFLIERPVRVLMEDCEMSMVRPCGWIADPGSVVEIRNCTFPYGMDAFVLEGSPAFSLLFINNIVTSPGGPYCDPAYQPDVLEWRYNDVWPAPLDPDCGYQIGNFSEDPLFCGPGDYRVQPDSPCRGAGENGEDVGARWGICWPPEGIDDWPHLEKKRLWVSAPSPNPTTGSMRLQLEAPPGMRVEIDILDACGRVVRRLPSTSLSGQSYVSWDGRGSDQRLVRPGIYHIRLRCPMQTQSRRVAIVR